MDICHDHIMALFVLTQLIIFKNFVNLNKLADVQILEIEGLLCFPAVSQGIFCSKSEASSLILKYITVSF